MYQNPLLKLFDATHFVYYIHVCLLLAERPTNAKEAVIVIL